VNGVDRRQLCDDRDRAGADLFGLGIPVAYDNSYRMVTVSTRSRKRVELGGCG
jgi:hypothetical protein